jgi:hypothetical protein
LRLPRATTVAARPATVFGDAGGRFGFDTAFVADFRVPLPKLNTDIGGAGRWWS